MKICHIVAASLNRVIGIKNGLPWHIPEDLKYFKDKTKGKVIIMGRKTYESINKKPLPNRANILVSRTIKESAGFTCFQTINEAIGYAKTLTDYDLSEIFIVGGGEIYKETMSIADRIYYTEIGHIVDGGEVYYPEIPLKEFNLVSEDKRPGYNFMVFDRS
ncbi:MAG: dihydrofolate reductase [Bdellovibrionales bacterium]|nr:dihydrofolate reductase [Bdellovibrionales bacterium]